LFDSSSSITSTNAVSVNNSSQIIMEVLANSTSYSDDNAASAGGVPFAGLYRDGSNVRVCLITGGGTNPNVDPYSPKSGTPVILYNNYTSNSTQQLALSDLNFNSTQPVDGNGNNITFANLPSFGSLARVSASDSYQYIAVIGSGLNNHDLYISDDYGQTFSSPAGSPSGTNFVKVSKSGKTILYTDQGQNVYHSSDFGNSFQNLANNIPGNPNSQGYITISGDGKYILWRVNVSNILKVYLSSDYGNSFVDVTIQNGFASGSFITGSSISGNGQYMYFISSNSTVGTQRITTSSDYGINWTNTDDSSIPPLSIRAVHDWSGQYSAFLSGDASNQNNLYYYTDFVNNTSPSVTTTAGDNIYIDNTGRYLLSTDENFNTYQINSLTSNDFLSNFTNNINVPAKALQFNIINT